jgi:ring-1,2-phenylacetyl-CoA epoxidase subunit PaaE
MTLAAATRFHAMTITDVRRETADAVSIGLRPPPGAEALFAFRPGQYLTVRRIVDGEEVRRAYSICSGLDDGELRIGVKRVPGGAFSPWAQAGATPGDRLDALPPEGRFTLMPDAAAAPRSVLGIACGSGITPVLGIARSLLAREPGSRFVLLYGNRATADIMFREALEDLKDRHLSRFSVIHVLSRETHELAVLHGRLDGARIAALLPGLCAPGAVTEAFLCGPGEFAQSARMALEALGFEPARIHAELFSAGQPARRLAAPPPADARPAAMLTVTVEGVTRELPMAAGETVLDAGLRAGLDLPWSCRNGMCCTCRARVVQGEVAMAVNYSLQPWEIDAGFVLTCQSRPATGRIALDYDAA